MSRSRNSFVRPSNAAPLLALAAALLLPLPASASASTMTQAFTTPGEHQFVVPPAVTTVQVTVVGANGGAGTGNGGGQGATISATLAVTPGQTLFAEVGGGGNDAGNGQDGGLGGVGGGGNGGAAVLLFVGAPGGGGGGGATDVRTCSANAAPPDCGGAPSLASRLLVAGGGAGGGGSGSDVSAKGMILGGAGGSGGGPGGPGGPDPHGDLGGQPGHQGNQASGGVAGANSAEAPATDGQLGKGGYGGTAPAGGGGGGGGGLYGGGGGGAGTTTVVDPAKFILATAGGGGGGGGSSGMPAGAAGVSSVAIEQTKPGGASTTFSWQRPAPGASTQPAASVTANAARLNGSVDPNGYPVTDCHFELTPAPAAGPDVPCGQQIGAGNSPVAVSANVAGLAGSTAYRYKLVVASAEGSSSGDQVDFTTEPGETATPPPPGAPDPRLGALTLSPSRFRVAARGRRRAGTTIAFSVPQPAKVAITFERAQPGRRKYKRVRGVLRVTVPAGAQRVRFLGKVGGRKLRPGRYRVSAVATDAAGHSSPSQHAAATVLR